MNHQTDHQTDHRIDHPTDHRTDRRGDDRRIDRQGDDRLIGRPPEDRGADRGTGTVTEAVTLVGLLADVDTLRVFAALVLGVRPTPEVAEQAGLSLRDAVRRLTALEDAGLAARAGDGWHACPERLREAVLAAEPDTAAATAAGIPDHVPPAEAAVLRTYLVGGRIEQLPAQRAKRLVVLDHVAGAFEPGLRYTDREVAAILSRFTTNVGGVRRLLLDEGFLGREGDLYWRTGGTFIV